MFQRIFFCVLLSLSLAATAETRPDYGDASRPEFFPILPWEAYHGWLAPYRERSTNGFDSIADCHFNFSGFVLPRDLKLCRRFGLNAIVLAGDEMVTNRFFFREWRNLSDKEIDERIRKIVKQSGSSSAIKGYFIMDEPGIADFPALGKAVAAVKKYAPRKFAYINLFPDYATLGAPDMSQLGTSNYTEYLERFVSEVHPPFISYDNYQIEFSRDLQNSKIAASYFHNLLEVRRVALEHHLPYLNIVTANQIRPTTTIPSPANLSLQAYTTLAAGYRGVGWFTYYKRGYHYAPVENNGRKTLTWFQLQEINRQIAALTPILSRLHSTGVYFSAPAPVGDLPLLPGKIVQSVESSAPLMIGELADDAGKQYIMIVNLSLEKSVKMSFKTRTGPPLETVSAVDGAVLPYDPKTDDWLTAGQGRLFVVGRDL